MMKSISIAALAAVASAQCTINPSFTATVGGTNTDGVTYTYTPVGTAVEFGEGPTGTTLFTGRNFGVSNAATVTLLAGFSSSLDGNNGLEEDIENGIALAPANYETHEFTAPAGECFYLHEGGVTIADIDHDHDDDNLDDNYHDAVSVIFTLADGSQVAGDAVAISTRAEAVYANAALNGATLANGNSNGLVMNTDGADPNAIYSANDVAFADQDLCSAAAFCDYGITTNQHAAIYLAPEGAEVTGITVRYFNSFPTDMPSENGENIDAQHLMGVALLENPPTCTDSCAAGTTATTSICVTGADCDCVCEPNPECTDSCGALETATTGVTCPTDEDCDCECTPNPECTDSCEDDMTATIAQCLTADACECACVDFPECTDSCGDDETATIAQCDSEEACECVCVPNPNNDCEEVVAECGAVTATGSTTTGTCICLSFGEEEEEEGEGDGGF